MGCGVRDEVTGSTCRFVEGVCVRGARGAGSTGPAAGFSLLELVIVLAVTVLLTSLMLPALSQVRENLHRVVCASNLRQLGFGVAMYARDQNDRLPYSAQLAEEDSPLDLMIARYNQTGRYDRERRGWDGLGRLYLHDYCSSPECFYCPSHYGEHTVDRYDWAKNARPHEIVTNYHYGGHMDWVDHSIRSLEDPNLVLAVDGLPTATTFNHLKAGMNTLRGDGSVRWHEGDQDRVAIDSNEQAIGEGVTRIRGLWNLIEEMTH